jgi:hypothetical protein
VFLKNNLGSFSDAGFIDVVVNNGHVLSYLCLKLVTQSPIN